MKTLLRSLFKIHQTDTLPANTVVIVSGLPRSGTSMAMRMLEAGGLEVLTDEIREADRDTTNCEW